MQTAADTTATRKHIIEANETVLCLSKWNSPIWGPRSVIAETPAMGRPLTVCDLLDELTDDDTVTIRRLNVETWSAPEDITEEVARHYLYVMDEREGVELGDEDRFPAYVRNSRAWALWKDDLEASAPVHRDPDRLHDERRDHQVMGLVA
ncbi:hypothetical protein REJC140_00155 [Pseudorhizobium endolithicum]|uniref:Uncharacterized protein n=1 Tax=Pseudorhizobium endolithicum TaxID=1191678 RepID=A0ABN7JD13_9HYPH|nr:hypothetical protein [Pseudorhizobium endolithicum]CAD7023286.1 hypothetical protein REJC140_00155 [Pseudorhizobium endolithicum]